MRIQVNLATEPFRRDRPMLVASVACGVVLVALLGVLIFLIVSERGRQTETRTAVAKLNSDLRKITDEQAKLDGTLRLPMNAEVLEQSLLLNSLIQRKSISWTRLFADIEGVKPDNVRLIQVRLPADQFPQRSDARYGSGGQGTGAGDRVSEAPAGFPFVRTDESFAAIAADAKRALVAFPDYGELCPETLRAWERPPRARLTI